MDEHERRALAEEDMIGNRLRLGQHLQLFPDVLNAVEAEPLRERRWRQLMLALYRCGRNAESLRQFQQLRANLREVGRRPSAPTEQLERMIVQFSPELDWTGSDSLTY